MIETTHTIEGSGYPLAFRSACAGPRAELFGTSAGAGTIRVEARAMGGHQKEAVITEGDGADSWRVVSDEGPILGGSDLAPFPLGFFNAGLQADLAGRIGALAAAEGLSLDTLETKLTNRYAFQGSFFAGTGQGSAESPEFDVVLRTSAPMPRISHVVRMAARCSPAIAALRTPLVNTFSIYVNGRRGNVEGVHASPSERSATDPFVTHANPPAPIPGFGAERPLITRDNEPPTPPAHFPAASDKMEIVVGGSGRLEVGPRMTHVDTWLERPTGTRFGFTSDEAPGDARAPGGLALLSAGISFCYLTQLLRYVEYRKHGVRAIRLVQFNPYTLENDPSDGSLRGIAHPVDTHLFLNGGEPDEVMRKLLLYSARTCYLHAALATPLAPRIFLSVNGAPRTQLEWDVG